MGGMDLVDYGDSVAYSLVEFKDRVLVLCHLG